jgi:hypothetical protein
LTKFKKCGIIIIEIKKGGSDMERFIVIDFYSYPDICDCPEVIGRTDSEEEANKISDKRYDDTDNEADVCIYDMKNIAHFLKARDYGFLDSH